MKEDDKLAVLQEENKFLKEALGNCLLLIKELSSVGGPIYEKPLSRELKMFYVRTVSRAKKLVKV